MYIYVSIYMGEVYICPYKHGPNDMAVNIWVQRCMCLCRGRHVRGSLNTFPYFFRMGTFIDSTHVKL